MTAAELEAMAETMERAAKALREEAAEKRKQGKRGTSILRLCQDEPITDLDQAAARAALLRHKQRRGANQ